MAETHARLRYQNSRETPSFQYFYRMSDRSVQCAIGTKNPETTVENTRCFSRSEAFPSWSALHSSPSCSTLVRSSVLYSTCSLPPPSLFPTMPRHNFYAATPYVKQLCNKYGLEYNLKPVFTAFADIVR